MGAVPARERLLEAAARLFYADGLHATGIDTITAEAGVAKMSLYNNFSSKEELMLAYLDARHRQWWELYRARTESVDSPIDGVLAVFDAYIDHATAASPQGFRGCGLLNAAAELPVGSAGREAVRRHKAEVQSLLTGHLLGLAAPETARETAEHLALLLEGAMSLGGLDGSIERLQRAKALARPLVVAL